MSRRKKNSHKLAFVIDNPPNLRGQRQTAKLLKLLDAIQPTTTTPNRENAK